MSLKMLVHEHYKPGDSCPINNSKMDLGPAWLFNIVLLSVRSHSWLGFPVCSSFTVKRQMQKEQSQSTLSCKIKSLFASRRDSLLASCLCQLTWGMPGQAGCGKRGLAFRCNAGAAVGSKRATGLLQPLHPPAAPVQLTVWVSLGLGSPPHGSKQTGLQKCTKAV